LAKQIVIVDKSA